MEGIGTPVEEMKGGSGRKVGIGASCASIFYKVKYCFLSEKILDEFIPNQRGEMATRKTPHVVRHFDYHLFRSIIRSKLPKNRVWIHIHDNNNSNLWSQHSSIFLGP